MPEPSADNYRFGEFNLESSRGLLFYRGQTIAVPPKAFAILEILLAAKGGIVSRDELTAAVWGDIHVTEGVLAQHILTLRKRLAEHAPEFQPIEAVPRRGYRIAVPVETAGTDALPASSSRRRWILSASVAATGLMLLSALRRNKPASEPSGSPESLFQRAHELWRLREGWAVDEATGYFRYLVQHHPRFARGYWGLANCLVFAAPVQKDVPLLLDRASLLDPNLSEVHATRGFYQMVHEWNWSAAEASLRRAVAIEPQNPFSNHWMGLLLSARGRWDEARATFDVAIQSDPHFVALLRNRAVNDSRQGRHAEAISRLTELLELESQNSALHQALLEAHLRNGDPHAIVPRVRALMGGGQPSLPAPEAGVLAHARAYHEWLLRYRLPVRAAVLAASFDLGADPLGEIARAIDGHDFFSYSVPFDPLFHSLSAGPRWASTLAPLLRA